MHVARDAGSDESKRRLSRGEIVTSDVDSGDCFCRVCCEVVELRAALKRCEDGITLGPRGAVVCFLEVATFRSLDDRSLLAIAHEGTFFLACSWVALWPALSPWG